MKRNDDKSVDVVAERHSLPQLAEKKDIEALEAKLSGAHPISISIAEAQLLRSILRDYAEKTPNTAPPKRSQPTRLTNFATVAGTGAVTGVLCVLLFPTQPIVSIVAAIFATIAAKIALPWMNSL